MVTPSGILTAAQLYKDIERRAAAGQGSRDFITRLRRPIPVNKCNRDSSPIETIPRPSKARLALDPKNAEALWKKSEEMVGESF
jgi:hypothetical protein